MLSMSKAIGSSKLRSYFREEYSSASLSYYSEGSELKGQWMGTLAAEMGLTGPVDAAMYDRLAEGQDPFTGEQLIRHRKSTDGSMEHRAGFDCVFSAPKTFSLTTIADPRIRDWHREAVEAAYGFYEQHVQSRLSSHETINTGKSIAAAFEHDSARPVDGYSAPLLHTHVVMFNITSDGPNGTPHSIQPKELFNIQTATTRVYQNVLAYRALRAGYQIETGANNAPEISGYTKEYIEAESQRSKQIARELEERGLSGKKAESMIAREYRSDKLEITSEQLKAMHLKKADEFGNQPALIASSAGFYHNYSQPKEAVDFAIRKLSEREAAIERDGYKQRGGLVQTALEHARGSFTLAELRQEIERRSQGENPELVGISHYRQHAPGQRFATAKMLGMEQEIIQKVMNGQNQSVPIENYALITTIAAGLNDHQKKAIEQALASKDQIIGIQGSAGTGKTTALKTLAADARLSDWTVKGLAPISGAVAELSKVGIKSETLAKYNRRNTLDPVKMLYLLDETSLVGTKQLHKFFSNLRPTDKVLIVGDIRQHDSIEAGRIFDQLQQAGMQTFQLTKIIRQRENPQLLEAVQHFHDGKIREGVEKLETMGTIHEFSNRNLRYEAIAATFMENPEFSIVVSPDNASRKEINAVIRESLVEEGYLKPGGIKVATLIQRQDVTSADLALASTIREGETVKTPHGYYKAHAPFSQEFVDGYRPTAIYTEEEREFRKGDRIQFTQQWKEKGIANRTLATIEKLNDDGKAVIRLDPKQGHKHGQKLKIDLHGFSHIDYGYTMTSYSMQGQTKHTVIANVDTGDSVARSLLDRKMIYVMASRASHQFSIFTDSKPDLANTLDRQEEKATALSMKQTTGIREAIGMGVS